MGKSSVGTGFAKCFILFMAIVILLQGVVYLGLAIWGITLRNCSEQNSDISQNPFQFAIDLIYFIDKECGNPSVTVGDVPLLPGQVVDSTVELQVEWATSEFVTDRMYIILIVYAAISGLWVVTSLLIIVTLCAPTTKVISGLCYWPWFLVVLAGSILDAVATGFHVNDITHTTSFDETFAYVGISTTDINEHILMTLRTFDAYFITPAVVMTCISSRLVIIWLLNIFGTIFCLSLARGLSSMHSADKKARADATAATIASPATAGSIHRPPITVREVDTTFIQQEIIEQYPEQIKPKPLPIIIPTASLQQPDSRGYQSSDRTSLQSPMVPAPNAPAAYESAPSPLAAKPPPLILPNDATYRNTETHPDRLNYPPKSASPEAHTVSPQLAATSPLNNRYSESFQFQNQPNNRASEELRGQLPWSYTSMLAKPPPPPRKPVPQVQIYPQIPEPDYTEQEESRAPQQQAGQQNYSRW